MDMTPMIDIIFNLLLFFILSSSYVQHTAIEIKVPSASSGTSVEGDMVAVELTKDDRLFLGGKEIVFDELEPKLRELYPAGSDTTVVKPMLVRADAMAYHSRVVAILDVAKKVGVRALAVETVAEEKEKAAPTSRGR